jgi:hypothetical protein
VVFHCFVRFLLQNVISRVTQQSSMAIGGSHGNGLLQRDPFARGCDQCTFSENLRDCPMAQGLGRK